MSASLDWAAMETAIGALLPRAGGAATRGELTAGLAGYSSAAVRQARALGPLEPSAEELTRSLAWLLRPVFVCGHHRSGTTLLQSLLDGHPQLLTLPSEGTYFTSFAYAARAAPATADLETFAARWIERFVDPNFAPHFRLGRSDARRSPAVDFARSLLGWHAALRGHVPPGLGALLALPAAFKNTTAPESAPLMWVEKTPQNERYASRLARLEHARFLHVVRDPRATLASMRELYRINGIAGFDAAAQAQSIGRSLRLAVDNRSSLGHRYLVVRYEDLVGPTAGEVERVRRFLAIAPAASLLKPTAGGSPVPPNSSFGARFAGGGDMGSGTAGLGPRELSLLGVHAARAARPFGYDLEVAKPLASAAVRARHLPAAVLRSGCGAARAVMRRLRGRRADRFR